MNALDDVIRQVVSTLRGMWHWRWIGLSVAWVVGIIAVVFVIRMPNEYEASARIFVDTQSVLKPLMSGLAVQPNINQQVMMLSRTLITRPNVDKLIRMADLDHTVKSSAEREALIDTLMRQLRISGTGRDNLYRLTYRAPEPERAHRVVQSLTSMFVESSLGGKRKDTDAAKQFIEEQIRIYEQKLTDAENRLKEFRLKNLSLNMGEEGDSFRRIGELSSALNQAQLALREAENSRDALRRQIAGEPPVLEGSTIDKQKIPVATTPEIDARLQAMTRNLDSLLQRFTDEHPDVLGTRRVIKQLEEQKRKELALREQRIREEIAMRRAAGADSSATHNVVHNPVYQQLKVSLADAEANVASLRTRVAEYDARYSRAKASMRVVPEIEAQFAQLNRDYAIHKKNYETLVARRESATMSGQMEAAAVLAEFRLIEPPRVTPKPVAPNRLMLFHIAMLAALGAGVLASLVASFIRPCFFDLRALREVTGMPVLGRVSLIVSDAVKRKERRGLIGFITASLALIASYGAAVIGLLLFTARA